MSNTITCPSGIVGRIRGMPNLWDGVIGEATIADSVRDRLVHNAHRVKLKGDTVSKGKEAQTK